jgi:7-carboxy-7-deazaguanine synthase
MSDMLSVSEIFHSIQGESSFAGYPCGFVRLAGCNLRCVYCDTRYAYDNGTVMSIDRIVDRLGDFQCGLVEITGGEPLCQEDTPALAQTLLRSGHTVLVETNGTLDIRRLPEGAIRIMDIKCPGSGESHMTRWDNLDYLKECDEVKFVIGDESDYQWMKDVIRTRGLSEPLSIIASPVHGKMEPARLAELMLQDRLHVRLQPQLHKILWPAAERGR